jgi:protein-S-isoprenylcysteine O-methyltransferase Ste14
MPLSEHEQRLLEQIERALYAEDPKFASTVRGGRLRKPTRRRRLQGVAVFVLGLVLLVVGVAVPQLWLADSFPVLSVVGFLVMLGGAVVAVTSVGSNGQAQRPTKSAELDKNRFTGRMEERFRRRFEQE